MGSIIQFPYGIASRQWVEKLIKAGYLRNRDRHNAEAVKDAVENLKQRTKGIFMKDDKSPDTSPT